MRKWLEKNKEYLLYLALIQSLVATLGSLYFSEIRHFTPCVLCWYQRIFMYPLTLIIGVGIIRKDKKIYQYVFPMTLIGGAIALFHNLLYYKILPENVAPCVAGVSCTTRFFAWFGFITIPLLSLIAFLVITFCMLIYSKLKK